MSFNARETIPLFEATTQYTEAYHREQQLEVIRLLLNHGADPARKVWKGKSSALEMARHYAENAKKPKPPEPDAESAARAKAYDAHQLAIRSLLESR